MHGRYGSPIQTTINKDTVITDIVSLLPDQTSAIRTNNVHNNKRKNGHVIITSLKHVKWPMLLLRNIDFRFTG